MPLTETNFPKSQKKFARVNPFYLDAYHFFSRRSENILYFCAKHSFALRLFLQAEFSTVG
jgi:hypothetical protein